MTGGTPCGQRHRGLSGYRVRIGSHDSGLSGSEAADGAVNTWVCEHPLTDWVAREKATDHQTAQQGQVTHTSTRAG